MTIHLEIKMHSLKQVTAFVLFHFSMAHAIGPSTPVDIVHSYKDTNNGERRLKSFVSGVQDDYIDTVKTNVNPTFVNKLYKLHKYETNETRDDFTSILPGWSRFKATVKRNAKEHIRSEAFHKSQTSIYPTRQTPTHFINSALNLHDYINDLLNIRFSADHERCFTIIDNILEVNFGVFCWYQENYTVLSHTGYENLKTLIQAHFEKNSNYRTYLESRSWTPYMSQA